MNIVRQWSILISEEEPEGLNCIRQIPRKAHHKLKSAEAYRELMGEKTSKMAAAFSTFLEVFFFVYVLYAWDVYLDIDLVNR